MSFDLSTWFQFGAGSVDKPAEELPDIFPLPIAKSVFIETDVVSIYSKILTDVIERTHGIPEEIQSLLWDNCMMSEINEGLITRLARAIAKKSELFLVYDAGVLRNATGEEQQQITADYKKTGSSTVGVYISFARHTTSDMVILYSALEFFTIASLHKGMNLSSALQIKIDSLRATVGEVDSEVAQRQALAIAASLAKGKDVYLDAKDSIVTTSADLEPINKSIMFLNQKRAFYLKMPASYINGEQTGGLGSTGEGDTKAVERGLKVYYFSVIKPALESIFGIRTSYKSQDFRQIDQGLEALKTFQLVGTDIVNFENQTLIVNRLFDLPEDAEGDGPSEDVVAVPPTTPFANRDASA